MFEFSFNIIPCQVDIEFQKREKELSTSESLSNRRLIRSTRINRAETSRRTPLRRLMLDEQRANIVEH
jgi:hypothetical protein